MTTTICVLRATSRAEATSTEWTSCTQAHRAQRAVPAAEAMQAAAAASQAISDRKSRAIIDRECRVLEEAAAVAREAHRVELPRAVRTSHRSMPISRRSFTLCTVAMPTARIPSVLNSNAWCNTRSSVKSTRSTSATTVDNCWRCASIMPRRARTSRVLCPTVRILSSS